ncbi:MAG: DEAD/DEAH box helicase family protein [Halodesulfurarchaeum sp.]|nr:DEAD/DEAH box helicase family protein [Halodesulfurarchaeum sp.]
MSNKDSLRNYQAEAAKSIPNTSGQYRSLVMPTGSGKTRVALQYADNETNKGKSVAYIVNSDAHAEQVLGEAEEIGVSAEHIPGSHNEAVPEDRVEDRDIHIEDYDLGLTIGIFSYHGYFLGSEVPRSDLLIVDDAHAFNGESVSYSSIVLHRNDWGRKFETILDHIIRTNPLLAQQIEGLEKPVHLRGETVLVPPPKTGTQKEALRESIHSLTSGTGYEKYLLSQRLDASPDFLNWPCVVTANSIVWRPFILPFESFGNPPHSKMSEDEMLLMTSMRDSEEYLQKRLGLSNQVNTVDLPKKAPEMGTRIVIPYPEVRSASPPSQSHINIINKWTKKFGSILVSVSSDKAYGRLAGADNLYEEITPLRYKSAKSITDFEEIEEPKILALVNRPSGIDIPSEITQVAIHLELPRSTSGHEKVAGDIEKSGTVADASLAVRLSQLLGRLNRSPDDRSVHLILAGQLPFRSGSVFVKSLDPEVLLDLIIGKRGFRRDFELPDDPDLIAQVMKFISGDDQRRSKYANDAEQLRRSVLSEIDDYSPGVNAHVNANLFVARGNFSEAAKEYSTFAIEASKEDYNAHASFYDYQSVAYAKAEEPNEEDLLGSKPEAVINRSLGRNPPSSALVMALRQLNAGQSEEASDEVEKYAVELDLKRQSHYSYLSWVEDVSDVIPDQENRTDINKWQEYWRKKLTQADHDDLLDAYIEAVQLLGTDTPHRELDKNDAKIVWKSTADRDYSIALEIKGWDPEKRDDPPELKEDNVEQARTNADHVDADAVLLATSRKGRQRRVPEKARQMGVSIVRYETAIAFADLLAEQCVAIEEVESGKKDSSDIPYHANNLKEMLSSSGGEIDSIDVSVLGSN